MNSCIVCKTKLVGEPLLHYKNMPYSAQLLPSGNELNKDSGIDLSLYQCSRCGLIQLNCEPVPYYRDVIRGGGYSSTMKELRYSEYARFVEKCELKGKKIIEIGCGQGEFLETLNEFPVKAYGIENNDRLVMLAQKKGLNVLNLYTETENIVIPGGPFDAFLSFNYLEHQPDPNVMLKCIYNNLCDGGYGLITVPEFNYILENNGFYELIHDHIAYYTNESLSFVLNYNGFEVLDTRRVNGDTIEMTVKKRTSVDVTALVNSFDLLAKKINEYVNDKMQRGKKIAVWGASHQAFTILATTDAYKGVSYIIDSAQFKQGKYSPVSHLPIVAPEYYYKEPVECILIIAPAYTEEIRSIIREKFDVNIETATLRSTYIEIL